MPFDLSTAKPAGFDINSAQPAEDGGKPFDWIGAVRKTLQGITMGAGDEIASAIRADIDSGIGGGAHDFGGGVDMTGQTLADKYAMFHDDDARNRREFTEDHPVLAPALEFGGAMSTGLAGAGKLATMRGISALTPYKQAAAIAGLEGGLYGTMAADRGTRAQGGAMGATAGAIAAPALMAGGNIVSSVARPVARRVANAISGTPERDAVRALADTLSREGLHTPDQIWQPGRRLATTLADQTQGGRNLASGLVASGDEYAGGKAAQYLERNKGQFGRTVGSLDEGLDIPEGANWHGVAAALRRKQGETGKKLYDEAAKVPLRLSKWFRGVVEGNNRGHADVRRAWKSAQNKVAADRDMGDQVNHFAVVNQFKKDLDDKISGHIRAGNRNEVRRLTRLKNRMLDEIDAQNGAYKTARNAWADDASIIDAGEAGKKIFQADVDELPGMIARLSEPEKVAYRLGVKKAVREKLMGAREGNDTISRIDSMLNMEKLRSAFPDDAAFRKFKTGLDAEREAFETYRVLAQNSRTAFRQQDVAKIEGKKAASDADLPLSKTGMVVSTLRRLFRSGLSKEARKELTDMVMTPIADLPPETMRMIEREVSRNARRATRREIQELFAARLQRPTAVVSGVAAPVGGND